MVVPRSGGSVNTHHLLGGCLVQVAVLVHGTFHAVGGDVDAAGIAARWSCLVCTAHAIMSAMSGLA